MSVYHSLYSRWDLSQPALNELSYQELHEEVLRCISWYRSKGISRGDRICIQLPKSTELLIGILAALAMGCPILPLNDKYTATEVEFYLQDCKPSLVILSIRAVEWSETVQSREDFILYRQSSIGELPAACPLDQLALFLYTSGTTGKPKGAMISHRNIIACIQGLHDSWQWSSEDHLLHVLPLFHVHGLIVAQFGALYANARSFWLPGGEPKEVWKAIAENKISVLMAVPTIHYRLLQVSSDAEVSSLRLVTSGSAPLPVSLHQQFYQRFGFHIVERYGMTEVGIVLSNPYGGECRPGTVGFPLGDTQFRIVDTHGNDVSEGEIGELMISGSSVISAYWQRPEQTKETIVEGWLRSGDLARQDEDGYFCIVGRAKDLIISGGMNVYPREIERCLLEHESVQEVAVIGIPDEEWGERVVAVVIGTPKPQEVLAFARQRLSSYKCPKEIVYTDDFPRNAMGKIQKSRLRSRYG